MEKSDSINELQGQTLPMAGQERQRDEEPDAIGAKFDVAEREGDYKRTHSCTDRFSVNNLSALPSVQRSCL